LSQQLTTNYSERRNNIGFVVIGAKIWFAAWDAFGAG